MGLNPIRVTKVRAKSLKISDLALFGLKVIKKWGVVDFFCNFVPFKPQQL